MKVAQLTLNFRKKQQDIQPGKKKSEKRIHSYFRLLHLFSGERERKKERKKAREIVSVCFIARSMVRETEKQVPNDK